MRFAGWRNWQDARPAATCCSISSSREPICPATSWPRFFKSLSEGGFWSARKAAGGGFAMARPAHQISLMQVVEAMEGPQLLDRCVVGLERCNDQMPCPQHDLYKPIRQRLKDYLNTTSVADPGIISQGQTVLARAPITNQHLLLRQSRPKRSANERNRSDMSQTNTTGPGRPGQSQTPGPNAKVRAWVDECAAFLKPDKIVWCDGSIEEREPLLRPGHQGRRLRQAEPAEVAQLLLSPLQLERRGAHRAPHVHLHAQPGYGRGRPTTG